MIISGRVPNHGPKDARVYLVGESPGADEVEHGIPFIGVSGQKLRTCLGRAGLGDDDVRLANLCQYRPKDNKFAEVLGTSELKDSFTELVEELKEFRPNVVGALGAWPLYYLTGKHGKRGKGTGIGKWRGSILPCSVPGLEHIKVIASYHPAFVARNAAAYPVLSTDIKRIAQDRFFPELRYPEIRMVLDPRGEELDRWTEELCASEYLACDIESIKSSKHILCHGFSPRPGLSVVISHSDTDLRRQDAIRAIYSSKAKKIFHNGYGFDLLMLKLNGMEVENYFWDTMIAQHIMWAELPKSLDYLASVYTRVPYYKTAGRAEIPDDAKGWSDKFDRKALYEYNGTDTHCTIDVAFQQMKEVAEGPPNWRDFIDFTMQQARPAMRISMAGMLVDQERRATLRKELLTKWGIHQFVLDRLTGYRTNVNSPKVMARILYDKDKMGLPPKKKRNGGLTTDEDAIVSLIAFTKDKMARLKPGGNANEFWRVRHEVLKTVLIIRGIRKLLSSYLNVEISEDGRIRGLYKITGAGTGRWSCSSYIDGTGTNCQTFPREALEIKDYAEIPQLAKVLEFLRQEEQDDINERTKHEEVDEEAYVEAA